jgi:TolA-binding protein
VAPDAQFFVAETYAGEGNATAAEEAYGAVVRKYPSSPRAAAATYKRAQARARDGKTREAAALYEQIVKLWPRSDEAALAREALRAPR